MYFDDLFDIKGIIELSFQYSAYWFGNRLIERDHSCQQNLILPAFCVCSGIHDAWLSISNVQTNSSFN